MSPLLGLQTSNFHLSKITKIVLLHPPPKKKSLLSPYYSSSFPLKIKEKMVL